MKNKKSRKILFYATILLLLAVNLFPFLIMLMTSFKDSQEAIATTQTIFPKEWTFEHYQDIFNAEIFPFIMYFKNSLVISLIASVTAVVIGISFDKTTMLLSSFPYRSLPRLHHPKHLLHLTKQIERTLAHSLFLHQ